MRLRFWLGIALMVWCGVSAAGSASDERFREGLHYQRISPPEPRTAAEGKVEVVEMFLYACPHCYELDPKLRKWLEDKPYVEFRRVPAIVGPGWADQARAFYMARELGKPEELDKAMFKVIHEDGEQIYNQYAVLKFFIGQGYEPGRVDKLYLSSEIADDVNEARRLTVKYNLRGVPAVIVNGEYVTAPYFVRDQEQMLEVLDSLVERERARLAAKTASNEVVKSTDRP